MNHEFKVTIEHNGQIFGTTRKISTNLIKIRPDIQKQELNKAIDFVKEAVESRINLLMTFKRMYGI